MEDQAPGYVEVWLDTACPPECGVIIVKAPTGVRYVCQGRWVEGYVQKVLFMGDIVDYDPIQPIEILFDEIENLLKEEGEKLEGEIVEDGWVRLEGGKVFVYVVEDWND